MFQFLVLMIFSFKSIEIIFLFLFFCFLFFALFLFVCLFFWGFLRKQLTAKSCYLLSSQKSYPSSMLDWVLSSLLARKVFSFFSNIRYHFDSNNNTVIK